MTAPFIEYRELRAECSRTDEGHEHADDLAAALLDEVIDLVDDLATVPMLVEFGRRLAEHEANAIADLIAMLYPDKADILREEAR